MDGTEEIVSKMIEEARDEDLTVDILVNKSMILNIPLIMYKPYSLVLWYRYLKKQLISIWMTISPQVIVNDILDIVCTRQERDFVKYHKLEDLELKLLGTNINQLNID